MLNQKVSNKTMVKNKMRPKARNLITLEDIKLKVQLKHLLLGNQRQKLRHNLLLLIVELI
jgi:hypothetical protein